MKHKKTIEKYQGTLEDLAKDIGNLDYDAMAQVFALLSQKFATDAQHDLELKHPQVAEKLKNISDALKQVLEIDIQPLADLCRTYNEKGIS
jgi:hypothetical protein